MQPSVQKILIGLLAVLIPALLPAVSIAGMTWDHYLAMQGEDAVIVQTNNEVFIATVEKIENINSTNSNPPKLLLSVEEVLRGSNIPRSIEAIWRPFPNDIDTGGREAEQKQWDETKLTGPNVGEKFIFVGEMGKTPYGKEGTFYISPIGRFPYSAEKLAWAKVAIENGKKVMAQRELEQRQIKETEEKRLQDWDKKLEKADINKLTQKADFIVVAKVVSGATGFEVQQILKGKPPESAAQRYVGGRYFFNLKGAPEDTVSILYKM